MHYYQHHIGDFDAATRHLTRIERSIYRDLIELYYSTERMLSLEIAQLARKIAARTEEEKSALIGILDEFFHETPGGWFHDRCEEELEKFRKSMSQASAAGKASAAARAARREAAISGISETTVQRPFNDRSTTVEVPFNDCSTEDQREVNSVSTNHKPSTRNQKPEEQKTTSSSGDDQAGQASDPDDIRLCPVGTLVDLYHECMPNNPRVKVLNEARRGKIRQRWREAGVLDCAPFGYSTRSAGLAAWREFFTICAESAFLTGRAPAQPGKPPFVADIDFIMSPAGFAKTIENKYHREAA